VTLCELKRTDEALASYQRAVALRPDYIEAHNNLAATLHQLERFAEAVASFDRALALRPDCAEALTGRGVTLYGLKRFEEALASFDRALAARPDYVEALANRGLALKELKRFDEALASFDRALALRPDDAEAHINRGNALRELKRIDEALASYDRAIAVRPDYVEAFNNRSVMLQELRQFDEALASLDRALALRPDYVEALTNRAVALHALKRFDEALLSYERVQALRPDYAEAHCNESHLRLLMGDFELGWRKYEWRWKNPSLEPFERTFQQPLWLGEDDVEGKTILIHSEQGFGDVMQFCRYVPLVAARGAQVLFGVPQSLYDLMTTSFDGTAQVLGEGAEVPQYDRHCPLMSLPLAFGTTLKTIPSQTPYLRASHENIRAWSSRLGAKRGPRIGVVWSGNPAHKNDHNRSIDFRVFSRLLDRDATFVSLQKEVRPDDASAVRDRTDLLQIADDLMTFADTAAVVANLDLIISVDTSVAHLAGALAIPVWILLPFVPEWRWLIDRSDSPWYPTARLFRQDAPGDWPAVIDHIVAELKSQLHVYRERSHV
jgi:tetratricopeptide (TPR) repeat protein